MEDVAISKHSKNISNFGETSKGKKIILHIDLDCFYCQVEQRRLGISNSMPLAVQQWNGLLAVNYAARNYNISRSDSVSEAKAKCPDLILVHVPTYTMGKKGGYHANPQQNTHKVCLDWYRRASAEVFDVLRSLGVNCQKSSVDEAYLDITDLVEKDIEIAKQQGKIRYIQQNGEYLPVIRWDSGGPSTFYRIGDDRNIVINQGIVDEVLKQSKDKVMSDSSQSALPEIDTELLKDSALVNQLGVGLDNVRLYYGSLVCYKIREMILSTTGFTTSAGISFSKAYSKVISSTFKPNKQAVLLTCGITDFIYGFPVKKIRNLGGKVGERLEEMMEVKTIGELYTKPLKLLEGFFSSKMAIYMYNICRGIDTELVEQSHEKTKTLASVKSFGNIKGVSDFEKIQQWVSIQSIELWERMLCEFEVSRSWPRVLTLTLVTMDENGFDKDIKSKNVKIQIYPMNSDVSSNGSEKFLKMVEKSVDEIFEILNTKYGRETVTYDENSTVTVLDNTTKSGFLARYPLKRILIQIGGFYHFESTNTLLKSWAENPLATYGKKCSQSKNVDPTNSHGSLVVGKDNNVFSGKSAGGTGGTSDVLASSATSESNSGKNEGNSSDSSKFCFIQSFSKQVKRLNVKNSREFKSQAANSRQKRVKLLKDTKMHNNLGLNIYFSK